MDTAGVRRNAVRVVPGTVLRLRDAAGRHLGVLQGAVWITQLGDHRDPVIEAGESFRFTRDGVSLLQALGGEAIVVLEEGLEPETANRATLLDRVRAPFRRAESARDLVRLSDHTLRDLGLRREQLRFGTRGNPCLDC